jgi:hypothetical protein
MRRDRFGFSGQEVGKQQTGRSNAEMATYKYQFIEFDDETLKLTVGHRVIQLTRDEDGIVRSPLLAKGTDLKRAIIGTAKAVAEETAEEVIRQFPVKRTAPSSRVDLLSQQIEETQRMLAELLKRVGQ